MRLTSALSSVAPLLVAAVREPRGGVCGLMPGTEVDSGGVDVDEK